MTHVYHGSIKPVASPICHIGRPFLDFGRGFYVTDIPLQAERWAARKAAIQNTSPVVSEYEFDITSVQSQFKCRSFAGYDAEWLEFVVANRMGLKETPQYDLVVGGVADDRVIDSVEAYISGFMTVEETLSRLAMQKPNNQICIRNQAIIDNHLHFVASYNVSV